MSELPRIQVIVGSTLHPELNRKLEAAATDLAWWSRGLAAARVADAG
jgi:hypothetical protein